MTNQSPSLRTKLDRSLPTLGRLQAIVLFVVGVLMVLASMGMLVFEVLKQQEITKVDLMLHGVFIGGGFLLMVPRRCLAVSEQLLKTKWFAKK
jgi:hypothetical protein